MQVVRDFKVFTAVAGMVISAAGIMVAQSASQSNQQSQTQTTNQALPGGSTNTTSGSVGDTMGDAQSRQMDKRFLGQVIQASMLNVAMGKLAAEKSTNDSVKQFGLMMAKDHERGLAIFKKVAAKDGVDAPDQLDAKHKERLDKLAKLSGSEFDRAYVKDQLKAHQRMVSYFESEAENSNDTAARKMATNMLPAVLQHMDAAKDLNRNLSIVAAKR